MTEKIKIWSLAGFAVSPLSHERHEELVERLRIEAGTRKSKQAPLVSILANLGDTSDLVCVVGWNVDIDPGILISGNALHQDEAFWREAYPEGFVVCDQPLSRLLLIDFDEDNYAIEEFVFSNRN